MVIPYPLFLGPLGTNSYWIALSDGRQQQFFGLGSLRRLTNGLLLPPYPHAGAGERSLLDLFLAIYFT